MPRKRDIDPRIWENEQLANVPIEARLLFIGMFSNADDEGRLKGSPRWLKAQIFRYDDLTSAQVQEWRDALLGVQLIHIYEEGEDQYIHLPTFGKWQSINRRFDSKLPPCTCEAGRGTPSIGKRSVSESALRGERATTTPIEIHEPSDVSHQSVNDESSPTEAKAEAVSVPETVPEAEVAHVRDKSLTASASTSHWLQILRNDGRWPSDLTNGFVEDLESSFKGVDLVVEAHKAYDWLQTTPKGKKRKDLPRFWLGWLQRALKDQKSAQAGTGNTGPPISRRATRVEVERDRSKFPTEF